GCAGAAGCFGPVTFHGAEGVGAEAGAGEERGGRGGNRPYRAPNPELGPSLRAAKKARNVCNKESVETSYRQFPPAQAATCSVLTPAAERTRCMKIRFLFEGSFARKSL